MVFSRCFKNIIVIFGSFFVDFRSFRKEKGFFIVVEVVWGRIGFEIEIYV